MEQMQDNPFTSESQATAAPSQQHQGQLLAADAAFRRGITWFYWIAGLSLVNSVLILSGANWGFIVGLGATQMIDGFILGVSEGAGVGTPVKFAAFALDLLVAGIYVLIGFLGLKRIKAAIIVGMVFYALDGLIFLMIHDFLSIGFHIFVLFCVFTGLKALNQLTQLERINAMH